MTPSSPWALTGGLFLYFAYTFLTARSYISIVTNMCTWFSTQALTYSSLHTPPAELQ